MKKKSEKILIDRYHQLNNKHFQGNLSSKEKTELKRVEKELDAIDGKNPLIKSSLQKAQADVTKMRVELFNLEKEMWTDVAECNGCDFGGSYDL